MIEAYHLEILQDPWVPRGPGPVWHYLCDATFVDVVQVVINNLVNHFERWVAPDVMICPTLLQATILRMPKRVWDLRVVTIHARTSVDGVWSKAMVQAGEDVTVQHPVASFSRWWRRWCDLEVHWRCACGSLAAIIPVIEELLLHIWLRDSFDLVLVGFVQVTISLFVKEVYLNVRVPQGFYVRSSPSRLLFPSVLVVQGNALRCGTVQWGR